MRRDASGASGHVTAKPSICGWDAFCKSGVYAGKVTCLTPGDLPPVLRRIEAGRLETDAEYRGEVSRGRSRNGEGAEPQKPIRRPERYPERGLKERRSRLSRKTAIASGESRGREPAGWDESGIGAVRDDAPVDALVATASLRHNGCMRTDPICRTAVYVTRSYGGVGGGRREAFPYPD
jgi:hypothetical protein